MPIAILELSHTRPFSIVLKNIIIAVHSSFLFPCFGRLPVSDLTECFHDQSDLLGQIFEKNLVAYRHLPENISEI